MWPCCFWNTVYIYITISSSSHQDREKLTLFSEARRDAGGRTTAVLAVSSVDPLEPMCLPATGDNVVFSAADSANSLSLRPGTAGWPDPFICTHSSKHSILCPNRNVHLLFYE